MIIQHAVKMSVKNSLMYFPTGNIKIKPAQWKRNPISDNMKQKEMQISEIKTELEILH